MSIQVEEYFKSRAAVDSEDPSTDLIFKVICNDGDEMDDIGVRAAVAVVAPSTYDGLVQQSIETHVLSWGVWESVVQYGRRKKPEVGDVTENVDTTGGTAHITQALETVGVYGLEGETPPPCNDIIGLEADGTIVGVDVPAPAYKYGLDYVLHPSQLTANYKRLLYSMKGTVNSLAFRDFAIGECRFDGGTYVQQASDPWIKVTLLFEGSENATDIQIGDCGQLVQDVSDGSPIPIWSKDIAKKGHEYLWVRYEATDDDATSRTVKKPEAVYVQKVLYWADHNLLLPAYTP